MAQAIAPFHPAADLSQTFPTLPQAVLRSGERTAWRFVDFFTASIRNPNTREAYYRAVTRFPMPVFCPLCPAQAGPAAVAYGPESYSELPLGRADRTLEEAGG
jgi:hypothetical protein